MAENELIVIWNKHGEGSLIGIFDDQKKVDKLKKMFNDSDQTHYMGIYSAKLNEINKHALEKDLPFGIRVPEDM